jgi:hypothetical protein
MLEKFIELPADLPALPLSFGLEALIAERIGQDGHISAQTIAECALRLWPEKVVQQHLEDLSARFIQRVERMAKSREEPDKGKGSENPKRNLGANLQEWTQSLDHTGLCLYLADYDPERAHRLYWRVEADLLELTLHAKLRFESTKHLNAHEAALYGFGGSYADDGEEGTSVSGELDAGALKDFGINF